MPVASMEVPTRTGGRSFSGKKIQTGKSEQAVTPCCQGGPQDRDPERHVLDQHDGAGNSPSQECPAQDLNDWQERHEAENEERKGVFEPDQS